MRYSFNLKEFKDQLVVIGISDETAEKVKTQKNPTIEYYNAASPAAKLIA